MPAFSPDGSSGGPGTQAPTPSALNIIRFALLAGVVFFGGIAWFMTRSGQDTPALEEPTALWMRYIFYGFIVLDLVGLWLVRQRADRAETFAQRAPLLILGYALAEGLALYGAVYLFLTGNAALFLGGLLVFLLAFLLLPVQPAAHS